ncbi:UPF0014-domain-containing protein, partial [Hesseltinella vesiculosa]
MLEVQNATVEVTWWDVLKATSFIIAAGTVSFYLGLELETQFIIASVRCVVQLSLMGLLLDDVLRVNNPWVVFFITMTFIFLGSYEVVFNRTKHTFAGIFPRIFGLLVISIFLIGITGTAVALRATPFWTPQKFIPIIGMLLGNTIGSITVAIDLCLGHISLHAPMLDARLAMGASRYEASRPLAIEAIQMALLPIIAQVSVMGLINIPGTMVGLLVAGAEIQDAVIYQQVLMFMITSSCTLGSILAVAACLWTILDRRHRLQLDRIQPNRAIVTITIVRLWTHYTAEWRQKSWSLTKRYTKLEQTDIELETRP